MCGICGEFSFTHASPDLAGLQRMLTQLKRRGPEHEGSYCDGPVALGHRRLAILDLSVHANQPMIDATLGLALVFNGTIYNFPQLRMQLQGLGYHFFSHGDSEVILKAYSAWGERCVEKFHGMFAFALWDMQHQRLLLARDRLGIKPLYFSHDPQRIRFASNTQALLAAGAIDCTLDTVALHHHFSLHGVVPAPRTLLRGIRKLPPAHIMTIDATGNTQLKSYWELSATRLSDDPQTEQEWSELLYPALLGAVERRLRIADVPVGVLLSGGLDSSLLVALLAQCSSQAVSTFSIGFEDQPEERGSEFEYSDQVVARFDTQHHKLQIPNDDVLLRLPEAVVHMAEPMVGQDAVAFYLLAEQVSRYVKVVQSGQGADEVFGGYFWYSQMQADTNGSAVERFRRHYLDRDHEEFEHMLTPAYVDQDYTTMLVADALAQPGADTFMDAVLRFDVTTLIVDDPVKRVDNMTMAFGLEARVPFLDHTLVELAARMPSELKLKEGGKGILKQIARGKVPDSVIDRPKGYFPVPALKYVRGSFLEFMRDILTTQACRERGLYQRSYIDTLLAQPETHLTRIQGSKLWHLALLELWLQTHVD